MLSFTIALIVLNLSLGVAILIQGRRETSAIIFFLITLVFSLLSFVNYHSLTSSLGTALYWVRFEMFLAACHAFLFFVFVNVFGNETFGFYAKRILLYCTPFILILNITLSPLLFSGVSLDPDTGGINTIPGKLLPVFGLWLLVTMVLSMRKVANMYKKSEGVHRHQWRSIFIGTFATYFLLIFCNFILAGIFQYTNLLKYTPLYSLPIIVATAYAIIKHGLFNIKVLATEAFVILLVLVFLLRISLSETMTGRIMDGVVITFTIIVGFLLVRSVQKEVEAREEVRELAKRLGETNWELARINEQLRVIDQRKSEFVSIVSHQLRTPITAIKGYSSLLLEDSFGPLNEKQKPPVEKIFISSKRLAEMVNDFLDISKIEQGTMSYNFVSVDIKTMLVDLMEEFAPVAKEKHIGMSADFTDQIKYTVTADEGKLRQILSNILDNSIKYTPNGDVHISLEKDEARGTITVRMKDSGIGLSQDDIHHLFGKFTRGSGGQRENTNGSGLGLYVAMKMLKAMHGKIWVDSEGPNKGSTFAIELLSEEEV